MEQSFTIAFWMLLLVGFLHATPIPSCFILADMDEIEDVTCENMTFVTPANVQSQCYNASLTTFIDGLLQARESCEGDNYTINTTLEILGRAQNCTANAGTPSTECSWEKEEFRKPFDSFVSAIRPFIQQLYGDRR